MAAAITADGTKRALGLHQGVTENAAVCVALLEDLQARGLDTNRPVLLVLDGAKALHSAAKRVWGQNGVIQRCQVHKTRNLKAHVSEKHWPELVRRLLEAYHDTDYATAEGVAGKDGAVAGSVALVCGGAAASRGQVPPGEGASGDACAPQGSGGCGPGRTGGIGRAVA